MVTRDEIEAELSLLLNEMEGEYGDRHEVELRIRQLVDNLRAYGLQPPEDLLRLDEALQKPPEE